jgi:nitrous oxidase accessory protein
MLGHWITAALIALPGMTPAEPVDVLPGPGALAIALNMAEAGQVLRLGPGRHDGGVTISKELTLHCQEGAEIAGPDEGSTLIVDAANVAIIGCKITGSGTSGADLDSGITLNPSATAARIENNHLVGNYYGVNVHGAKDTLVVGNRIEGRRDLHMNSRGNGVHIWNAPGTTVTGNDIRWGRDGIFVTTSRENTFTNNRLRDLRFAVHYMFAHDSLVAGNISQGNHLGFAVMSSDRVQVQGNLSSGDRDHGIMLNYTNKSTISGNRVEGGSEKCIFIYNAHKNRVEGNWLQNCQFGIHFTAGSERNIITLNAFVANRTQVKYAGTRWVDWSEEGRGNYWSNFAAYDIDRDGIADGQFRPNSTIDRIMWTQPAARLLLGSPAVQLVRWSQTAFPALLPGGVVDSAPLMQPNVQDPPVWERENANSGS